MYNEKYKIIRDVGVENSKKFISELNEPTTISFKELSGDEQNFVIVIVTLLMRRVSETNSAGEMIFVDCTRSADKFGLRVFSILTKVTGSGGIPISIVIITSKTTSIIQQSFEFFASFMNEKLFDSRVGTRPAIIMTDDSAAKVGALRTLFSKATMLLCSFHLLQACNRWIQKRVVLFCD